MNHRLVALDTETTGLETSARHRIIEIGAVEIINRQMSQNQYHRYIQPERNVGDSIRIHGISDDFLVDKPLFSQISEALVDYLTEAETTLIIHNAAFDVGFLNYEFELLGMETKIAEICEVIDTIEISKSINPRGQHSLDALARRYKVDLSKRAVHGALLDAQILAQVYLAMTGGQREMFGDFSVATTTVDERFSTPQKVAANRPALPIIVASKEELALHHRYLEKIRQ